MKYSKLLSLFINFIPLFLDTEKEFKDQKKNMIVVFRELSDIY